MLYAFIILDKTGFSIFEHFSDHISTISQTQTQIMDTVDMYNKSGDHFVDDYFISVEGLNDKFNVVVVYSNETIDDEIKGNLRENALSVLQGDKFAIQKVFGARNLAEFQYQ